MIIPRLQDTLRAVATIIVVLVVSYLVYRLVSYFGVGRQPELSFVSDTATETNQQSTESVPIVIEEVARDLYVPWSIVFTSQERMLITERSGAIRVIENGKLRQTPLKTFPQISARSEEGLMGMTLDPDYETNKYLYVAYAYPQKNGLAVRVVRFTDEGSDLTGEKIIIDAIPAAQNHAGTRLRFGPDKKLYITTGDASDRAIAQDMGSLGGKILRVNADGTIPADNPYSDSPIWSYGHRNSQGLDWHPVTKELYATEHGPSLFDGPAGGDEVNRIEEGANYGWPLVSHENTYEGTEAPLVLYTPAVAPASGMFYSSDVIPQFTNSFFFGGLRGQGLFRVVFDEKNPDVVLVNEKLEEISVGRIRDVATGPDGYIYFSTSNRDGRGNAAAGDDKIYRIIPAE